jgi:hypothetical protein
MCGICANRPALSPILILHELLGYHNLNEVTMDRKRSETRCGKVKWNYRRRLHGWHRIVWYLVNKGSELTCGLRLLGSILEMQAAGFTETLITMYQTTGTHNQEDHRINLQQHKHLKSRNGDFTAVINSPSSEAKWQILLQRRYTGPSFNQVSHRNPLSEKRQAILPLS